MLQIVLALVVTFFVAPAVPRVPIKPMTLLPKAKESTLASVQTRSEVNLRPAPHEDAIKLLAEPLEKPILNRTETPSSGHFQTTVPDLFREPIKNVLAKTSLPLPDKVIAEENFSQGTKTFGGDRRKTLFSKSINGGFSSVLTQTLTSGLPKSWSSKSENENMDKLVKPLQQANVLTSLQSLNNGDEKTNIEQILIPDPAYQSSMVFGKEFKFTLIPYSFIRLKQESIVAPPQDNLIEPGEDKSVAAQKFDFTLGEEAPIPNILAQQALDALRQESADVFKLDSISSLALECLLPPLDDHKSDHNDVKPSLGLLKESHAEPVKTILNLWESDEYDKLGSDLSEYDETRTTDEEGGDNNYEDIKFEALPVN